MVELCGGKAAQGHRRRLPAARRRTCGSRSRMERLHTRARHRPARRRRCGSVLTALGFGCRWVPPDRYVVRVPYWRTDVAIADDVVEEVARIIGYDQLPTTRSAASIPAGVPQPLRELRERVRDVLAAAGMQEVITYSLTRPGVAGEGAAAGRAGDQPAAAARQPAEPRVGVRAHDPARTRSCRRSPRTSAAPRGPDLRCSRRRASTCRATDDLPQEVETLCGVVTGRAPDRWGQPDGEPAGFFDAKALPRAAVRRPARGRRVPRRPRTTRYLPGRTADVVVDGTRVGLIGQVHPRVASQFDIEARRGDVRAEPGALLPHVARRRALPAGLPVPAGGGGPRDHRRRGRAGGAGPGAHPAASPLVARRRASSTSTPATQVPPGKKSLAFSVTYQSPRPHADGRRGRKRQRERILARLRQEVGAELRG